MQKSVLVEIFTQLGWQAEEFQLEGGGFNFAAKIDGEKSNPIHFTYDPAVPHLLLVIAARAIGGELWDRLDKAEPEKKRQIVARAKQMLYVTGVQFLFDMQGEAGQLPKRIQVATAIDESRVGRAELVAAAMRVHTASHCVLAACEEFVP